MKQNKTNVTPEKDNTVSWSRHSGYMRDGLDGAGDLSLMI